MLNRGDRVFLLLVLQEFCHSSNVKASHFLTDTDFVWWSSGWRLILAPPMLLKDGTKAEVELKDDGSPECSRLARHSLKQSAQNPTIPEVEKFVAPSYKEDLNKDLKTPRMVFTEAHENLLKEGQQWMKDTSSSSTVVAALIVTMAFAAMFTVPGGNNGDGKPLFLQDAGFMLFAVSDAIALFSSSTSVLMFLSVLTSRYAEEDFLYALPKRLTIGLFSLFMSLAATMVAFSATLVLVLRDKVEWIIIPVTLVACIPISLFIMLQFPLLVELVHSTYGKGIFYKQNDRLLH